MKIPSILLGLVLVFLGSISPKAFACSAYSGDPWYSLGIEFSENPLQGVIDIKDVNSGIHFKQDNIFITVGTLQSDLYFIARDFDMLYPGYRKPQKNYRPVANIIGNEYEPRLRFGVEQTSLKGGYVFHGGWDKRENVTANTAKVSIFTLLDETPAYKSKQKYGDDRPMNAKLPDTQAFAIHTHYRGKTQDITGTIDYKLNENYNPNAKKENAESCAFRPERTDTNAPQAIWYVVAVVIALSLVAAGLLLKRLTKKTKVKTRKKASKNKQQK